MSARPSNKFVAGYTDPQRTDLDPAFQDIFEPEQQSRAVFTDAQFDALFRHLIQSPLTEAVPPVPQKVALAKDRAAADMAKIRLDRDSPVAQTPPPPPPTTVQVAAKDEDTFVSFCAALAAKAKADAEKAKAEAAVPPPTPPPPQPTAWARFMCMVPVIVYTMSMAWLLYDQQDAEWQWVLDHAYHAFVTLPTTTYQWCIATWASLKARARLAMSNAVKAAYDGVMRVCVPLGLFAQFVVSIPSRIRKIPAACLDTRRRAKEAIRGTPVALRASVPLIRGTVTGAIRSVTKQMVVAAIGAVLITTLVVLATPEDPYAHFSYPTADGTRITGTVAWNLAQKEKLWADAMEPHADGLLVQRAYNSGYFMIYEERENARLLRFLRQERDRALSEESRKKRQAEADALALDRHLYMERAARAAAQRKQARAQREHEAKRVREDMARERAARSRLVATTCSADVILYSNATSVTVSHYADGSYAETFTGPMMIAKKLHMHTTHVRTRFDDVPWAWLETGEKVPVNKLSTTMLPPEDRRALFASIAESLRS